MKFILFFVLPVALFSCSMYPNDNFVEEEIEEVIMQKSGVNIDFTGSSPENWLVICTKI